MRSVRLNLEGVINFASNGHRLDGIYCVPVRLVGIDRSNSCQKSDVHLQSCWKSTSLEIE